MKMVSFSDFLNSGAEEWKSNVHTAMRYLNGKRANVRFVERLHCFLFSLRNHQDPAERISAGGDGEIWGYLSHGCCSLECGIWARL